MYDFFFLIVITIFCLACMTRVSSVIYYLLLLCKLSFSLILNALKNYVLTLFICSSCSLDVVYVIQSSVFWTLSVVIFYVLTYSTTEGKQQCSRYFVFSFRSSQHCSIQCSAFWTLVIDFFFDFNYSIMKGKEQSSRNFV